MSELNIAGIVEESIVDGPGVRFVIFVQGCPHACPGCHNPDTHSFDGGYKISTDELYRKIHENPLVKGVTFSGGEPFCQADALAELGARLQNEGYNLFVYSGYTLSTLLQMADTKIGVKQLLSVCNYLVDGPFLEKERDLTLKFRGSKNQKIYDITCFPNSKRIYEAEEFL